VCDGELRDRDARGIGSGGVLVARAGPKVTVIIGLALLAGSTLAFALLHDIAELDAARFVEGWAARARGRAGLPGSSPRPSSIGAAR